MPIEGAILTASAQHLAMATPDETLREIQRTIDRVDWTKVYLLFAALGCIVAWTRYPAWMWVPPLVVCLPLPFIYRWSRDRRTSQLVYDIDDQAILYRLALCNAVGQALASCSSLWHIFASVSTTDHKRNAGAGTLIRRTPTRAAPGSLPQIELNIEPWAVAVGPQQLLFLPDRLVVRQGIALAGVPYEALEVRWEPTRFIEEGVLPGDGEVVDSTWRFANKSGGPDRRFNDNRQLPVLRYGELSLNTATGVRVVLQTSRVEAAQRAAELLQEISRLARQPVITHPVGSPTEGSASGPAGPGRHFVPQNPALLEVVTGTGHEARPEAHATEAVATVLRFIAVADRQISDEEVAFAQGAVEHLCGGPSSAVSDIMLRFRKGLPSDEHATRKALSWLFEYRPELAHAAIASAEQMMLADGKATAKERERFAELSRWRDAAGSPRNAMVH